MSEKKAVKYPYPSEVLAEKLRDQGFSVRCNWEVKVNDGFTAWLVSYMVQGTKEQYAYFNVIVQTFLEDGYWEAWLPACDSVRTEAKVQAVIDRALRR